MTIQQLQDFIALCEELNYTHAARRLFITRQALRQNIAALEKELCCPLFENNRNRLSLTKKGRLLLSEARPVVTAFEALQEKMYAQIYRDSSLKLGISAALISDYLPNLMLYLSDFQKKYSGLHLERISLPNDEIAPAILAKELDCGMVMDLGATYAGIRRCEMTSHPAAILVSKGNPCFHKKRLAIADLDGQDLCLPGIGKEFAPLLELVKKQGIQPEIRVLPSFYQAFYSAMEHHSVCINRYNPSEENNPDDSRSLPLENIPPLCSSFLLPEKDAASQAETLYHYMRRKTDWDFR